ncbi:hypothetical protein ACN4EK_20460 [Pantanalinema rosaneae CENA516]|uniref:hypothetical protein n=1 Tax=Pantanalinema rosaneae TaxID=1620701 RepID=UPI003D6DF820
MVSSMQMGNWERSIDVANQFTVVHSYITNTGRQESLNWIKSGVRYVGLKQA